jgi:hypothetical protein
MFVEQVPNPQTDRDAPVPRFQPLGPAEVEAVTRSSRDELFDKFQTLMTSDAQKAAQDPRRMPRNHEERLAEVQRISREEDARIRGMFGDP